MMTSRSMRVSLWGLLCFLASSLVFQAASRAQDKSDPEEPKKLNDLIEKSINWYDILPEDGAETALTPVPVIRWRNAARGQEGEAMMVVWPHNGRPVAMASIYPWNGNMIHEFDSLSRESKLIGREKERVCWTPEKVGLEFKDLPKATLRP